MTGDRVGAARTCKKAYELTCDVCGDAFESSRPHTRTCSHRCRQRLHVQGRGGADDLQQWWRDRFSQHEIDALWAGISLWLVERDTREEIAA